jgi:hypothetical protein
VTKKFWEVPFLRVKSFVKELQKQDGSVQQDTYLFTKNRKKQDGVSSPKGR